MTVDELRTVQKEIRAAQGDIDRLRASRDFYKQSALHLLNKVNNLKRKTVRISIPQDSDGEDFL